MCLFYIMRTVAFIIGTHVYTHKLCQINSFCHTPLYYHVLVITFVYMYVYITKNSAEWWLKTFGSENKT